MNIIELTQPPVEPVTLEQVYAHLNLTPSGSPATHPDDTKLAAFISASRKQCEQIANRTFVEQRLLLVVEGFPCNRMVNLYRPPVQNVLSVAYYDAANVLQSVDAANYFVTDDLVPQLQFIQEYGFPSTYPARDALRIEYTAGYAPEGSPADYVANIPEPIKQAILLGVELMYDSMAPDQRKAIEAARDSLLSGFKIRVMA